MKVLDIIMGILIVAMVLVLFIEVRSINNGQDLKKLQLEEKKLSIQILQHELKAYEEMDKGLAE